MAGVRGLLISDLTTDKDTKPFGVTLQVQQEISSSWGSNVYRLMQRFDDTPLTTVAPELVKLTKESPTFRLAAYLIWKISDWAKATVEKATAARVSAKCLYMVTRKPPIANLPSLLIINN